MGSNVHPHTIFYFPVSVECLFRPGSGVGVRLWVLAKLIGGMLAEHVGEF